MLREEIEHAATVFRLRDANCLIMLGALNQPELPGRPGAGIQAPGQCRSNVIIVSAVDHHYRTRGNSSDSTLKRGIATARFRAKGSVETEEAADLKG